MHRNRRLLREITYRTRMWSDNILLLVAVKPCNSFRVLASAFRNFVPRKRFHLGSSNNARKADSSKSDRRLRRLYPHGNIEMTRREVELW